MNDLTPHIHECPGCGETWRCQDVQCDVFCRRCEDEQTGEYFWERFAQLPLPITFNQQPHEESL